MDGLPFLSILDTVAAVLRLWWLSTAKQRSEAKWKEQERAVQNKETRKNATEGRRAESVTGGKEVKLQG